MDRRFLHTPRLSAYPFQKGMAGAVVNVLSSYRLESVAVYDLSGRLLLEQAAEGIYTTLNVSALPRGTYIVAIRTLQGVATKKLVVER